MLNMVVQGRIKLDKTRVKDVFISLRKANREVLRSNKIDDNLDDFVYLTVTMKHPITVQDVTVKPPRPTPVQVALPTELGYADTLLLCKPGQRERYLTLVEDLGFGARINVEELSKTLKTKAFNKFDHLLVDASLKTSTKLFKRRHFPFPIKFGKSNDVKK